MKIKIAITYLLFLLAFGSFAQSFTINPTNANRGQRLPVTITGTGTNFARGSNTISFIKQGSATSNVNITNLTIISNTVMGGFINVNSTAAFGLYAVKITNTQNAPISLNNGFTVNTTSSSPVLNTIAPNTASQGQSLAVSITGTNTHFNSASNTVRFFYQGTETFDIFEMYNTPFGNTLMSSNILVNPDAPLGVYSVGVENSVDGLMILDSSFTVTANNKSLSSIAPNRGKQGETLNVSITGVNTMFNSGSVTFYFIQQGSSTSDIEVLNFNASSATSATFSIKIAPNTAPGLYDIGYFNLNDGAVLKPGAFTVDRVTGTNEISKNITKIFPNPAKNILNIESTNNIIKVYVFDITGKEILNKIPEKPSQNLQLDLTEIPIPKGIYFIKIQSEEGLITQKIIIE